MGSEMSLEKIFLEILSELKIQNKNTELLNKNIEEVLTYQKNEINKKENIFTLIENQNNTNQNNFNNIKTSIGKVNNSQAIIQETITENLDMLKNIRKGLLEDE